MGSENYNHTVTGFKYWVCYPEAAITISRQVALIFSEGSSQAAQSQDGVPLNNRTVPEKYKEHPIVSIVSINTILSVYNVVITSRGLTLSRLWWPLPADLWPWGRRTKKRRDNKDEGETMKDIESRMIRVSSLYERRISLLLPWSSAGLSRKKASWGRPLVGSLSARERNGVGCIVYLAAAGESKARTGEHGAGAVGKEVPTRYSWAHFHTQRQFWN